MTTNWRRLARNPLLDVGAMVIALLSVVHIATVLPARARDNDFAHYYLAGELLANTDNPYTVPLAPLCAKYGLMSDRALLHSTDPPALLWLLAPLGLLSPTVAFGVWLGVEVGSLALILWLTRRLLEGRLSARGWRFVCAGALASSTLYWHLYYSQVQLLLAALLLVAFACRRAGKGYTACLIVAFTGLLKLFPFVLLPWFLWRSPGGVRERAIRAVLVIVAIAGCVWLTGFGRWMDFLGVPMATLTWHAEHGLDSFSVTSLVMKFGGPMKSLGLLVGPALTAMGYWSCWRSRGDREAEFCLLITVMLAGGLVVWAHYFVFLIFPMAVVAARMATDLSPQRALFYILLLLCFNDLEAPPADFLGPNYTWNVLADSLPVYGLIALLLFFAGSLLARGKSQPARGNEDSVTRLSSGPLIGGV
jgi:hypothetical protein